MRRALAVVGTVLALTSAGCGDAGDGEPDPIRPAAGGATEAPSTTASAPLTTAEPPVATTTPTLASTVVTGDSCAHVIDGSVTAAGDAFTATATVRSADTGDEKYADRWEVRTADGSVLGERILAHPHVNEQPFTRSLSGLVIPDDIDTVVLVAHDSVAGFCGEELTVAVER